MPSDSVDPGLCNQAALLLEHLAQLKLTVSTAESCTGGLIASLLTDVEGYGEWFDRGFVVYTNEAKSEMLGVDPVAITTYGAVSQIVADQMARGALAQSHADLVISITGFAGPAGPRDEEGLVFLEAHSRSGKIISRECHFGSIGRDRIRYLASDRAIEMLLELIERNVHRP